MIRITKSLKNEPVRNFLKVFSSGAVTQAISFLLAPVIARLFMPSDFGLFALYLSIVSILSVFSTGKYEHAIMLPKDDKDSLNIVSLVISLSVVFSLVVLIVVPVFYFNEYNVFKNEAILPWLWFLPLSIFLHGFSQALNFWFNRKKNFGTIAKSTLWNNLPLNSSKLISGFTKAPFNGLIFSNIVSMICMNIYLAVKFLKNLPALMAHTTLSGIKKNAKKYSVYPKYNMLHTFANNFSGTLPIFLFTWGFSPEAAGLYSFGLVFVFKPANIISNSISQVLSQKTIENFNNKLSILPNIKKILAIMFRAGVIPFTAMFIFAPDVFEFVFSENYREAGEYLQILIPWLFVIFLTSALNFIPEIFFRQKTAMLIDVLYFVLRFAAIFTGIWFSDVKLSLILYSAVNFLIRIIVLIWYIRLAGNYEKTLKVNS